MRERRLGPRTAPAWAALVRTSCRALIASPDMITAVRLTQRFDTEPAADAAAIAACRIAEEYGAFVVISQEGSGLHARLTRGDPGIGRLATATRRRPRWSCATAK